MLLAKVAFGAGTGTDIEISHTIDKKKEVFYYNAHVHANWSHTPTHFLANNFLICPRKQFHDDQKAYLVWYSLRSV